MKVIQTKYNGYKFRSRTEARWAVFFDEMGIEYEYEPEGYDLDGTPYLPDFFIPEWDSYAEVKGVSFEQLSETEQIKVRKLAFYSRKIVIVLDGSPQIDKLYKVFEYDPWSDSLWENEELLIPDTQTDMEQSIKFDTAVNAARSARFEHGKYTTAGI